MDSTLLFLFMFILVIAVTSLLFIRNLFIVVIINGFVSVISAVIYSLVGAVDVAFTEAAIGAGVSTALLLVSLQLVKFYTMNRHKQSVHIKSSYYKTGVTKKLLIGLLFLIVSIAFLISLADAPLFNDISNPSNNIIYLTYVNESFNVYKVQNIVTMILGSFRGYDTLGETIVILLAALGVYGILRTVDVKQEVYNKKDTDNDNNAFYSSLQNNLVSGLDNKTNPISSTFYVLLPLLYLYAFYVQFHGDYGPGGGFQAGVVFAIPYILMTIILGYPVANQYFSIKKLIYLMSFGASLFLITGIVTIFLGGKFLDYYYFGNNFASSYHYGLFAIELGVGITVFSAMSIIIGQFHSKVEEV